MLIRNEGDAKMTHLTITEARQALLGPPKRLAKASDKTVRITRRGRPVLALMPWELYERITQTLEVLSDPEMMAALRSSLGDIRKARVVGHAAVRKRFRA